MNCYEFLPLLSGHIDQVNTAEEEQALQEHLRSCPECCALLVQMEQNDRLLRSSMLPPPADLTDRIMKEVRKNKKNRANKPAIISAVVSGLTVAAVMTLVFFGKTMLPAQSADTAYAEFYQFSHKNDVVGEAEAALEDHDLVFGALNEIVTEAVADASLTAYAPVTGATEAAVSTPEETFAAYDGLLEAVPEETSADGTELSGPAKRGSHFDEIYGKSPVLVIWNAATEDFSALSAYEPFTNNEALFKESQTEIPDTLLSRLSAALPFAPFEEDSDWNVTVYHVPYEVMTALFTECVGKFEVNAYYPSEILSSDDCMIFVIRQNGSIPKVSQEPS